MLRALYVDFPIDPATNIIGKTVSYADWNFEALANSVPIGIARLSLSGAIVLANNVLIRMVDCASLEAVLGTSAIVDRKYPEQQSSSWMLYSNIRISKTSKFKYRPRQVNREPLYSAPCLKMMLSL